MTPISNHPVVVAVLSLLLIATLILGFVMLGSHWIRNHVYAFALQSWLIACVSVLVAVFGHYPLLFAVAGLTAAVRGVLIPYLVVRIIDRSGVGRESDPVLRSGSAMVVGALAVIFAYIVAAQIQRQLPHLLPLGVLGLTVMLATSMISFLTLSLRTEALSNLLGLLLIENGILAGEQILVPGMPFLLEIVILFDLLVIIATFAVLARSLHGSVGSTDIRKLGKLIG